MKVMRKTNAVRQKGMKMKGDEYSDDEGVYT